MNWFEKMRQQKLLSFSLLLFTLSVGILIGTLLNTEVKADKGQAAPDAKPLEIPSPVQLSTAFSQLAKRLEPSVVNITTDYVPKEPKTSRNRQDEDEQGMDFFRRFFRGPFNELPQMPFRRQATGSGVIVDSNGYILTNNHVVESADRIKVKLNADSTEYEAKLIGTDKETDLAVIKINSPRGMAAAKIGNSDAVQVGDWAVAIGSPFGLETTVTAGIISAKERDIRGAEQFQHFLQTDAAINPGNSGGPLLNINGEVIGINTAIATQSGAYQGVGFALPINTAVKVYNQIIKTGRVTRGSIGVQLSVKPAPELLEVYGAKSGAFVSGVSPGSPADKAGLKSEDVIIAMNGEPIKSGDDLVDAVSEAEVGSDANLTVLRQGNKKNVTVSIGDRAKIWANDPRVAGGDSGESAQGEATQAKFGLFVQNLSEADRDELGFGEKGGVLVTRVDPASFADDIGIQAQDIIVEINRQPVSSVDDVRRIQNTLHPGDAVAFKVMRTFSPLGRRGGRAPQWATIYPAGKLPAKE